MIQRPELGASSFFYLYRLQDVQKVRRERVDIWRHSAQVLRPEEHQKQDPGALSEVRPLTGLVNYIDGFQRHKEVLTPKDLLTLDLSQHNLSTLKA